MHNKISLRVLDDNEMAQSHVTRDATLFAEMFLAEARKNRLTPEQVARDLETTTDKKIIIS